MNTDGRSDQDLIMDIALGISILTPILVRTMDAIQAGQDHVDVYCFKCDITHAWEYKEVLDQIDTTALVISGIARRDDQACALVVEQYLAEHR